MAHSSRVKSPSKKASHKRPSKRSNVRLYILLFILLLSMWWSYEVFYGKAGVAPVVSKLTQKNEPLEYTHMGKKMSRSEIMTYGINPDPVRIEKLPLNGEWEEGDVRFEAVNLYRMPDVADIGDFRNNRELIGKQFMAVEVLVRHTGTKDLGGPIPLRDMFRISVDGSFIAPMGMQPQYIQPQEDKRLFIYFVVDARKPGGTILLGPLESQLSVPYDFDSPSKAVLQGVFLYYEGYREQYP